MGQREVVQKFERVTFLVYGYPTNDKRTFHFQCLENDSCPWVVSLQELFLDWKYDILKEAQKSSKKFVNINENKVVCIWKFKKKGVKWFPAKKLKKKKKWKKKKKKKVNVRVPSYEHCLCCQVTKQQY